MMYTINGLPPPDFYQVHRELHLRYGPKVPGKERAKGEIDISRQQHSIGFLLHAKLFCRELMCKDAFDADGMLKMPELQIRKYSPTDVKDIAAKDTNNS
ncbi:hypothetical protein DMENIID0001_007810 [Sergentomyia squamirostris]